MKTPTCVICKVDTKLADAGTFSSIQYYFCPSCRNEVNELGAPIGQENLKQEDESTFTLSWATATSKIQFKVEFNPDVGNMIYCDAKGNWCVLEAGQELQLTEGSHKFTSYGKEFFAKQYMEGAKYFMERNLLNEFIQELEKIK